VAIARTKVLEIICLIWLFIVYFLLNIFYHFWAIKGREII